jgi:hypothetical protein
MRSRGVDRRVAVIASASGNGKTTVGRQLAARLGVTFVELDSLVHGPGWVETPDDELRRRLAPILASEGWVIDGAYLHKLGTLVLDAADTVVWLDLPMRVWAWRLLRRTSRRLVGRGGAGAARASIAATARPTDSPARRSTPRHQALRTLSRHTAFSVVLPSPRGPKGRFTGTHIRAPRRNAAPAAGPATQTRASTARKCRFPPRRGPRRAAGGRCPRSGLSAGRRLLGGRRGRHSTKTHVGAFRLRGRAACP